MAMEAVLKVVCDSGGSLDYDRLVDISISLHDSESVFAVIENSDYFTVIQRNDCKTVVVRTDLKLCRARECEETCKELHWCKFDLLGECGRRRCKYGHSLQSEHNSTVLRERNLHGLSKEQLRIVLLQSDSTLLPHVCVSYNKGSGEYGNCPEKGACFRLHVCENYIRGTCDGSTECNRCHDFYEPHPMKTLQTKGVSSQRIGSLLLTYKNIVALKDCSHARAETRKKNSKFNSKGRVPESLQKNAENVICLSFVKGFCKYGDKCWRIHYEMPYKWEVEVDQVWTDLPDNEAIERDYCDPNKTYSVGITPVRFDTMTQGSYKVRRVSTESSVLEPNFVLTTKWNWYWENEYRKWILYSSVKEMHRLSSINSEELEQKYLEFLKDSSNAVVRFTAGKQFYELNFRDMKQKNEMSDTERMVKRRPQFFSALDVQRARASRRGAHSSSQMGLPGFWDKTAIPDSGFQRVSLSPSDKDYTRVQERFHKTMSDFNILKIERVQNKELWEDFQTKRERMKKANKDKKYAEGERLLFHGTKSTHVDDICEQNVDMRLSGANGTVYGQGSYFARDAKYSHGFTDKYGERTMFACRVLVGQYTKGASSYRRPPAKDNTGSLYNSCVDDVRDPTIFVVFERPQVYPEFLITYKENKSQSDINSFQSFVCPVGQSLSQSAATTITSSSKPTALTESSRSTANGSQKASIITISSSPEKYCITSSSTNADSASSSLSTTTMRNPPTAVLDPSVSERKDLASSNVLVDGAVGKGENSKPVTTAPKSDQSSQLQQVHDPKPLAQFSSSELKSQSGQDLVAAIEVSVKSGDHQLTSNFKPFTSDTTVHSESAEIRKASCISDFTKSAPQSPTNPCKSVTLRSPDSDFCDLGCDVLDLFATQLNSSTGSRSFDHCSASSVSPKTSTYKSSLTSETFHSESATNQKSNVSSCTADFTKPAPRSLQDTDISVLSQSQASTLSVLYNTSSPSTNSQSPGSISRSSEVSNRQTAFSPPSKPQKNKQSDCVMQ